MCNQVEGPPGSFEPCPCENVDGGGGCPPACCGGNISGNSVFFGATVFVNAKFGCYYRYNHAPCGISGTCTAIEGQWPYQCPSGQKRCACCDLCFGTPWIGEKASAGYSSIAGPFDAGGVRTFLGYHPQTGLPICDSDPCCEGSDLGCQPNPVCVGNTSCACKTFTTMSRRMYFQFEARPYVYGDTCGVSLDRTCYFSCHGQAPCDKCDAPGCDCDPGYPPANYKQSELNPAISNSRKTKPFSASTPVAAMETLDTGSKKRKTMAGIYPFRLLTKRFQKDRWSPPTLGSLQYDDSYDEGVIESSLIQKPTQQNLFEVSHLGKTILNRDYISGMLPGQKEVLNQSQNENDSARSTLYVEKMHGDYFKIGNLGSQISYIRKTKWQRRKELKEHKRRMRSSEQYNEAYRSASGDLCGDGFCVGNRVVRITTKPVSGTCNGFNCSVPCFACDDYEGFDGTVDIYDPRGVCIPEEDCNGSDGQCEWGYGPPVLGIQYTSSETEMRYQYDNLQCTTDMAVECGFTCDAADGYRNSDVSTSHTDYFWNYSTSNSDPPDFRVFATQGKGPLRMSTTECDPQCKNGTFYNVGNGCPCICNAGYLNCPDQCNEYLYAADVHARTRYYSGADVVITGDSYGFGGARRITGTPTIIPAEC